MRLAVFSDVHGNLEALDLFIDHSRRLRADRYACLGDIIGYGPNPNECLAKIRSLHNIVMVQGNHEWATRNLMEASFSMNPMAYDAIFWTQGHLSAHNKEYISRLENKIETATFTFAHASAFEPEKWEYLALGKSLRIMLCLNNSVTRMTFVGHTHRPMIADSYGNSLMPESVFEDGTTYPDDGINKILVNPGSIGQPRDHLMKPAYVMVDTETNQITWHRLNDYDPNITAKKILETDLPRECAYYLTR